jgi:hypothetical protein
VNFSSIKNDTVSGIYTDDCGASNSSKTQAYFTVASSFTMHLAYVPEFGFYRLLVLFAT